MSDLELALTAAIQGEAPHALGALLGAWRTTRAPVIAEAIERASSLVARRLPPIGGETQAAAFEAWVALAEKKEEASVGLLVPAMFEGQRPRIRARLAALEGFPSDPRIGRRLVERVLTSWGEDADSAVATAIFKLLPAHADASVVDRLNAWSTQNDDRKKKLARVRAALAKTPQRPLSADELATLAKIGAVLEGEDLLAAARTDEARLVAADALQEQGDPRGELIVLHRLRRERPLTFEEATRERALRDAHARTWLGRLATVVDPTTARFHDGVLVGVTLVAPLDEDTRSAPEWATVREVALGPVVDPRPLLRRWPNLVEVTTSSAEAFLASAQASPALVHAGYLGSDGRRAEAVAITIREAIASMSRLRSFEVDGNHDGADALVTRWLEPLAGRFEVLRVHGQQDCLDEWAEVLGHASAPLHRVEIVDDWAKLRFVIERTGHAADSLRIAFGDIDLREIGGQTTELVRNLKRLPARRFSRVELDLGTCPKMLRAKVEEAAERLTAKPAGRR